MSRRIIDTNYTWQSCPLFIADRRESVPIICCSNKFTGTFRDASPRQEKLFEFGGGFFHCHRSHTLFLTWQSLTEKKLTSEPRKLAESYFSVGMENPSKTGANQVELSNQTGRQAGSKTTLFFFSA